MSLGEVCKEMGNSKCPLCRLFSSMFVPLDFKRGSKMRSHHIRAFGSRALLDFEGKTGVNKTIAVGLGVCRGQADRTFDATERLVSLTRGVIAPVLPRYSDCGKQTTVKLVNNEKADFQQMRDWLKHCQDEHSSTCGSKTSARPAGFKCINVHTRQIVEIDADSEYFALSYVYADSHETNRIEDPIGDLQKLPAFGIPQVIEDCFEVVRKLNRQYLWVDKYCINQNNPVSKRTQIHGMNKIYEGAEATIIAAPKRNSSPGLPGVSRCRMEQQPAEWVGKYLLASTLPHVSIPVAASHWATRGWTYQEAMLSKRCFYFTDLQVYFLCGITTSCESIPNSPFVHMRSLRQRTFRNAAPNMNFISPNQEVAGLWELFENLHHYKNRDLTYDFDSLNAFQGVLAKSGFKNIWGVPIACTLPDNSNAEETALSLGLARGLWWENPGDSVYDTLKHNEKYATLHRRQAFPSWSWAGWRGPIRPHKYRGDAPYDIECNDIDETTFCARFWAETKSERRVSLVELWRIIEEEGCPPPLAHSLYVKAKVHQVRIRRHRKSNNPIACICDCPEEENQCLKTHATVAHNVRFFEDPMKDSHLSEVVFTQPWYAIELFRSKDPYRSNSIAALIIDWILEQRDCARVVGVAYIHTRFIDDTDNRKSSFRLV